MSRSIPKIWPEKLLSVACLVGIIFWFWHAGPAFGQTPAPAASAPIRTQLVKRFLSIGTGSINGVYYPLGTAMARLFNSNLGDILVISEPTNGSVSNVRFLRNGDIALAIVQNDVAWEAFTGKGNFEGKPFAELRVLTSLYSEVIHVAVRKDANLVTFQDLRGKVIAIGEAGSGTAINARIILESAGLREGDFTPSYLTFTKATDALQAGYIDAVFFTGGVPLEGFALLGAKIPFRLLSFSEELRQRLVGGYPFLERENIPRGTYPGQDEDIPTVGLRALLITTSEFDPDLGGRMLRLLFGNIGYLTSISRTASSLNIKSALKGVDPKMLHPAAEKYFQENRGGGG